MHEQGQRAPRQHEQVFAEIGNSEERPREIVTTQRTAEDNALDIATTVMGQNGVPRFMACDNL